MSIFDTPEYVRRAAAARRSMEERREQFEGRLGLFLERPSAALVQVAELRLDDWGIYIAIECVPTAGMAFLRDGITRGGLSCCWEIFSGVTDSWSAPQVGWRLNFDPLVVGKFKDLCSQAAVEGRLVAYPEASFLPSQVSLSRSADLRRVVGV